MNNTDKINISEYIGNSQSAAELLCETPHEATDKAAEKTPHETADKTVRSYTIKPRRRSHFVKITAAAAAVLALSAALFFTGIHAAAEDIRSDAAEASRELSAKGAAAATDVNISDSLRTSVTEKVISDKSIPAYSVSEVMSMDVSKPSGVTVSDLKLVTKGGLIGLEEAFYRAEQDYGINCLFVMAIAAHESANGTMCFASNNMFGYGSSGFSSKAEGINVVARALANSYLSPSGSLYSGKTISDVNKKYAASTTWDDKVAKNMANYYSVISKSRSAALDKLR